jgi:hypothetical protein
MTQPDIDREESRSARLDEERDGPLPTPQPWEPYNPKVPGYVGDLPVEDEFPFGETPSYPYTRMRGGNI